MSDLDFKSKESYENSERTDFGNINGVNDTETLLNELTSQNGAGFEPIGNETTAFQGNFNGNEKRINNLYINNTIDSAKSIGFFGNVQNGTISNLTINGTIHTTLSNNVAGIVGSLNNGTINNCYNEVTVASDVYTLQVAGITSTSSGTSTITNCSNKGKISNALMTAGIVGLVQDGTLNIENCDNYGEITNSRGGSLGGIIGYINANTNVTIMSAINYAKLSSVSTTNTVIGGIVSRNFGNLIINNSINKNTVELNTDTSIALGLAGILGGLYSSGKAELIGCVNEGNITNVNDSLTGTILVGGIVGDVYTNCKIINSHNSGNLSGGYRMGGAVGCQRSGSEVLINNFYNNGELVGNNSGSVAGVVSYNSGAKTLILNSYNTGNVTSYVDAGGIVGTTNHAGTTKIINSFNTGNVTSLSDVANGIARGRGTGENIMETYNVYNIGTLNGATNKYGIGYYGGTVVNNNLYSYYENSNGIAGSTRANVGIGMALNNIKNANFVTTLNSNLSSIDLATIDLELDGYILNKWKLGSDGYPVLDGEFIEDLSGNNNYGVSYAALHNEEGLTTSTDSSHLGYADLGLKNTDFSKGIALITRVKINKFPDTGNNVIEGFWYDNKTEGGGLYSKSTKIVCFDLVNIDNTKTIKPICSSPLEENTWYTMIGTYDNNELKLYIITDELLEEKTIEIKGTIPRNTLPITLGARPVLNADPIQNGLNTYSYTLVFNRGIYKNEIINYLEDVKSVNKDNLLLWYKF